MLTLLLNIYTVSIMLAMICLALYFLKVKSIINRISIDKILRLGTSGPLETVKTILLCLFCPLFNILFSIIVMIFAVMDPDEAAIVINKILDNMLEEKEKKENETTDSE